MFLFKNEYLPTPVPYFLVLFSGYDRPYSDSEQQMGKWSKEEVMAKLELI
jgi:hypothetical protein